MILVVLCLLILTWTFTHQSILAARLEISNRITDRITNQAVAFGEQIGRQILTMDQTLRILARARDADPSGFRLSHWQPELSALSGISRDILLVDKNGAVQQATIPEAVSLDMSSADFVQFFKTNPKALDEPFVGPATIDPVVRLWHINVARALRNPDGSFAGALVVDYRISALSDIFMRGAVGTNGLIALIGGTDARIRVAVGPDAVDPEAPLHQTPMFEAIKSTDHGVWVGPSTTDSVSRIHAYRGIPQRDLIVVVAMEEEGAMRPATEWRKQALGFATGISVLLVLFVIMALRAMTLARRREAAATEERATLAASNAQLEVARAHAAAKTEQLEMTLAGMTDGVAMVDAHMCLVEWNARFHEIAGIPPELLRVGMPMEEILRAQARNGQFGTVDVDAEVNRRMGILRSGRFGTTERATPDGRFIELRRNRLPNGGFVTLYSDITDRRRAEQALQQARSVAEQANAEKSRFVAIVSHEIRTPLNALLNTLRLLADGDLPASQRTLVEMASQSGDALSSLINDILELSRAESGQLTVRPSRFAPRGLLDSTIDVVRAQALARGVMFEVQVADDVPLETITDPGRFRQVVLNLISNAAKFADPGPVVVAVWLVDDYWSGLSMLHVAVRDRGPVIPEEKRGMLFRPFVRLDRGDIEGALGTGLGLAICRHLVEMMGGSIQYDTWTAPDGIVGNEFMLRIAIEIPTGTMLDAPEPVRRREMEAGQLDAIPARPAPRTRILLVEDIRANQIVTATLLRRVGHKVDIAENGFQAIEAVQKVPYDIISMDMFMPGMNGQEATQRIRALFPPASVVPVVALTANVSPNDEANFREVGMNGILGKPVTLDELLRALRTQVWSGSARPPDRSMAPEERPMDQPDDKSAIPLLSGPRIAELRGSLPADVFGQLVEECLTDLDHRLPALRRSLATGAPGAIAAQAHAMVGIAAGYGMAALEAHLRVIMDAARDGQVETLPRDIIRTVEADLASTSVALRALIREAVA